MNNIGLNKFDRKLAVLIDPDKHDLNELKEVSHRLVQMNPDYILIGGSLVINSSVDKACRYIKTFTDIPIVLFPGHFTQLCDSVDGILLLSLISGRNPDLLIGQHVLAAPKLKELSHKTCSTGYMLIDGGRPTSVSYMSNTTPIPSDKLDIASCTAIAGEALGMKLIYLDAGSGAKETVSTKMIESISKSVDIPVIVGGGIREVSHIKKCWDAGANLVVIGNGIEEDTALSDSIAASRVTMQ